MLRLGAMSQGFGWEDVKQLEKYAEKDYLQDGITVSQEERNPYVIENRGDIADIREKAGLSRKRNVTEEALAEINMISDLSGMTSFMKKIGGVELYDCSECTPKIEEKCKSKKLPRKVGNIKTHYRFYNYGVPGGAEDA
jgi:heterodisulfide reductase subunit C